MGIGPSLKERGGHVKAGVCVCSVCMCVLDVWVGVGRGGGGESGMSVGGWVGRGASQACVQGATKGPRLFPSFYTRYTTHGQIPLATH